MRRILVAVALLLAVAGSLRGSDELPCANARNVLRVGIPRVWAPRKLALAAARTALDAELRHMYATTVKCGDAPVPPLDIQFTAGSDYQIFEWMAQGQVDAAMLSDLPIGILLTVDRVELYADDKFGTPRFAALPLIRQRGRKGWTPARNGADAYGRFLDAIWRGAPAPRVAFGSHLSTPGFVDPIVIADAYLESRHPTDAQRTRFWTSLLAHASFVPGCTSYDDCFTRLASEHHPEIPSGASVILFPGEAALTEENAPALEDQWGERLVIAASAAQRVFGGATVLDRGADATLVELQIDDRINAVLNNPAFTNVVHPDDALGFRTYGFNVDELLHLLAQDQEIRGRGDLALVLPGGGVKAAYQSSIIDALYGDGYLRNDKVPARVGTNPLPVQSVIGTSGGALLGFFVSQLDVEKRKLAQILWRPGGQTLRTADVFSAHDLMLYVSVLAAFAVLCLVLAVGAAYQSKEGALLVAPAAESFRAPRTRLLVPSLALLVAAPLLVRLFGGDELYEQVPELEGVFFAMLVLFIMFADQLLVRRPAEGRRAAFRNHDYATFLAAGAGILIGTFAAWMAGRKEAMAYAEQLSGGLLRFEPERTDWLLHPVTFGQAFTVLFVVMTGCALLLMKRTFPNYHRRDSLLTVLGALALTVALCMFVAPLPVGRLFSAALLLLIAFLAATALRDVLVKKAWISFAVLGSMTLALASMCWPDHLERGGIVDWTFLTAEIANMTAGTFLALTSLLILLIGFATFAYQSDRAYEVRNPADLGIALGIAIAHVIVVLTAVWLLGRAGRLKTLELSASYWFALVVSGVLAAVLILAVSRIPWRGREHTRGALRYLVSAHPNALYVDVRWGRLLLLGVASLVWWNSVLAPALYSNATARTYLDRVLSEFYSKRAKEFRPTARFIAPATLLDRNSARYFMFLPAGAGLPAIPQRLFATREWIVERLDEGPFDMDLAKRVVFASGSPFPVFPAHRVQHEWLIDGGYANNIPVDAARVTSAKQLLIIHSASPVDELQPSGLRQLPGKLIANLMRLPGFLFARSQEVDRMSRRGLFVASLAPPPGERDWPTLTDFDSETVEQMLASGPAHLRMRIGVIESWGEPAFQTTTAGGLPVQTKRASLSARPR